MKPTLLLSFLLSFHLISAQTFTEVQSVTDFWGVSKGSIDFADIDGDGDQDALITGTIGFPLLYLNDGNGFFTRDAETAIEGAWYSAAAFADVDQDGDQDVVIIGGILSSATGSTVLYLNDGSGDFTVKVGTPFSSVKLEVGTVDFADVNLDGAPDLMITGQASLIPTAKLYINDNDGTGNFTEQMNSPFTGVQNSAVAFADVTGNGAPDVIVSGIMNASDGRVTQLFTNDGMGNFTEKIGTPFAQVGEGSISFADVDGDLDQDVLITGKDATDLLTILYTNDGMGNFTEETGTPFTGVNISSSEFADVDNDGDQDVLITGQAQGGTAKLYINDGAGNFTEKAGTTFLGVVFSSIAFADTDNDGDLDAFITGLDDSSDRSSKLYLNDGAGDFEEKIGVPFDMVWISAVAFADVNNDGEQDVLVTGQKEDGTNISKLYINDSLGHFTEKTGTPFEGVNTGALAFADVDNDGDQDVLITGQTQTHLISKLYINDGAGNFTEKMGTPFPGIGFSSIAFADVDNDGDQDLMITGWSGGEITSLYLNDGMGNFSEKAGTPFQEVESSSIAFADVDNDGDQDLLITGKSSVGSSAKLYINDGAGNFTEMAGTPFTGVTRGSIAFADVDLDGDEDVLITGEYLFSHTTKLYINDGAGNFTEEMGTSFAQVYESSIAFADVNSDGAPDVLITGQNSEQWPIAELYMNDGMGVFALDTTTSFVGVQAGSVAVSDVNGDGAADVLITGTYNSANDPATKLYLNNNDFTSSIRDFLVRSPLTLDLYPNPASDIVNIKIDAEKNNTASVKIFDLSGRLIAQQKKQIDFGVQNFSLDISSLNPGVYIIQLDNGSKTGSKKLVVR